MKHSRMGSAIVSGLALSLIMGMTAPVVWSRPDVYVIYSGKNKLEKKQLVKAFPKELSVKSYNADLLALADYSGIQKAVSKFDRAEIIVILRDRPVELLKGALVKKDLFILKSIKSDVYSSGWNLHILKYGKNISSFGDHVKKRVILNASDLDDIEVIRTSALVLIDEKGIEMTQAVAYLIEKYLKGK